MTRLEVHKQNISGKNINETSKLPEWFDEVEYDVTCIMWPSWLQDLNPTYHLWWILWDSTLSHHHQNTKWGNICCKNVVDPSSWAPHICLVLSFVSHLFIHLDYCCSIKCTVILCSPPMILYRTTVVTMSASAATIHVTFCLSFPPFSLIPIYKNRHSLSVYQILLSPQILPIIRIILYMHATSSILRSLDSVYHASLHFITNAKSLTHHCILYYLVGWMSLTIRRQQH